LNHSRTGLIFPSSKEAKSARQKQAQRRLACHVLRANQIPQNAFANYSRNTLYVTPTTFPNFAL